MWTGLSVSPPFLSSPQIVRQERKGKERKGKEQRANGEEGKLRALNVGKKKQSNYKSQSVIITRLRNTCRPLGQEKDIRA
jgi:hypothetical protein